MWELRATERGTPYFDGEVEPCINGGVLALGATFGYPSDRLAGRLLGEQLEDGGWNCEAPKSERSSFHTTICVLEGLLEYERAVVGLIEKRRQAEGRWLLDHAYADAVALPFDESAGEPSRWNTLRSLRVLRWYKQPRSDERWATIATA